MLPYEQGNGRASVGEEREDLEKQIATLFGT